LIKIISWEQNFLIELKKKKNPVTNGFKKEKDKIVIKLKLLYFSVKTCRDQI